MNFLMRHRTLKLRGYIVENPGEWKKQEAILEGRKANAEKLKTKVEAWMNTIPMRMQRIIRLKHFERHMGQGGCQDGKGCLIF